ncbi:TPA: hypothetical protein ACR8U9_004401 [Citrobacter freundii]|nr:MULTISPECIES: hypothetical protein [Citrobacter]MBJ9199125.1 hypothetical protein [Citrobacter freundii]MDM3144209.1 hypothetical protein [Citrobacter sp. Cf124]
MLITDLFSHKIHSSGDDWPEKLIDIATIFNKFDGHPYDRLAIEQELLKISPRATKVARDPSKFRDEISAYPAYLGLYRLSIVNGVWHIYLSNSAKRFLVNEEPNVSAFLLIQLSIFQYPNGMGVAYSSGGSNLRIQANTKERTLSFIRDNIHLSPLRLICKAIHADSIVNNVDIFEASVSYEEIFILANDKDINTNASPDESLIREKLYLIREQGIKFQGKYESRFHILKHTDLFEVERSRIKLRAPITKAEKELILDKISTINNISIQFNGFDNVENEVDLHNELQTCSWSNYYDALKTLDQETIFKLTHENNVVTSDLADFTEKGKMVEIISSDKLYGFREINKSISTKQNNYKNKVYVDPELTRIRRQRANLTHKILLGKLNDYLVSKGATSLENEHIDLYAKLKNNKKFLFEVKSIDDKNLLSQTRKGISQLYEYRYRYQNIIGYDVNLCLVYPHEPKYVPWLQEYLCTDRDVGIMWFEEDKPIFSKFCEHLEKII